MNWKLCMKTPAGEYYTDAVETSDLPEYALQAPLRTGFSDAMVWIDQHTNWTSGTPTVNPSVAGSGNWEIYFHDAAKTCSIEPAAPAPHKEAPKSKSHGK